MQNKRTRAPRNGPLLKNCKTCGDPEVSTALIRGECPECSGQMTFTLRGEGGRFLKDLSPKPGHRGGGGQR